MINVWNASSFKKSKEYIFELPLKAVFIPAFCEVCVSGTEEEEEGPSLKVGGD